MVSITNERKHTHRRLHAKSAKLVILALLSSPQIIPPPVQAFSTASFLHAHCRVRSCISGGKTLLQTAASDDSSSMLEEVGVAGTGSSDSHLLQRARATFDKFDKTGKGGLNSPELDEFLSSLDMDATPEELAALFSYLDLNGDGVICFREFAAWYSTAVEAARASSESFRNLLMSRRTVNVFDRTPVSDDVLRRAIECAIAAPNRSGSEPWGFAKVGPATVERLQELNARVVMAGGDEVLRRQQSAPLLPDAWTDIPGWCVVTTRVTPDDPETELKDSRSTSCAMQNFMLSMWSEGVGSKWTEGPTQKTQQFADIVGIDTDVEKVVGIIWYGFTAGGLSSVDPKQERKRGVDDVLSILP